MHYRAYPTDVSNFIIGGNLINVSFGEVSNCGAPTRCVSSHPTNDEILAMADYTDLTLVSANLYRQLVTQAYDSYALSAGGLGDGNPNLRAYTTAGNRTLAGTLEIGSVAADNIQLVPTAGIALEAGAGYQLIVECTHPDFTRPIFFYQRLSVPGG